MKKTIATTIATTILGFAGIASAAPDLISYQVRGDGAYASAYIQGNDCLSAGLDITLNDEIVHSRGGAPVNEDGAWIGFWSYNWCNGEEAYGYKYISDPNATISSSSANAAFQVDIEFYGWRELPDGSWDYISLGTKPLTVSASWNAVGEAYRGVESHHARYGQSATRTRWRGVSRQADVTLNATLDGAPVSLSFAYGSIGSYSSGATEIYNF